MSNWVVSNASRVLYTFVKSAIVNKLKKKIFINQIEYSARKTRQTLSQPRSWCNDSGVLNLHRGYYTTIMTSRWLFRHNPVSRGTNRPIKKSEFLQCMKVEF